MDALVKGVSTLTGPKVTMPTSTRFMAKASADNSSRKVARPAFNSSSGRPLIEPDTSKSRMHGQRGSGLLAKSLVSKEICSFNGVSLAVKVDYKEVYRSQFKWLVSTVYIPWETARTATAL